MDVAPRAASRLRHRHGVLALLCALAVILYVDRVCISLALPRIQDDLRIAPEHLGWVGVAFSVPYALFEIPSVHLGGSRPVRVACSPASWPRGRRSPR